jgi:putative drug exporter of the RND superfamily
MSALTRWVLGHKLVVVAFWLIVTVAGFAFVSSATGALSQEISIPGEGFATDQTILHTYGNDNSNFYPMLPVVTLPPGTTVNSPGIRAQLGAAFTRVAAAVPGSRVVSYASTGNPAFVSRDGRTTFGLVYSRQRLDLGATGASPAQKDITGALHGVTVAGQPFHLTGLDVLANSAGGSGPSVLIETLLGAFGALLILIFVFRSFMAIVPLLMAVVAIPTTFLLVWGLTTVTDVSIAVEYLVAFIGLGIAIDYSLLVVMRWREERARGRENVAAVQRAMETAGRAVILSGTTVAVSLVALILLPVSFLKGMGYGGMLIPLVSVLVAVTLLPVILATVGPRLDWPRTTAGSQSSRFWIAWTRMIVRRRWIAAAAGAAILGALLLAATTQTLGQANANSLSKSGDARVGLVALERSGIGQGVLAPYEVLVQAGNPVVVARNFAGIEGVRGAVAPSSSSWRRAGTAVVDVFPSADVSSSAGRATLDRLRQAEPAQPGTVRLGGQLAENADFVSAVYSNFPLMLLLISGVTFVLLARAFRSILLALKAVTLNLLSVGAAWGVLVLVWQDGYGSQAIWGIPGTGSTPIWIPVLVFTFLFGLSMDYEVFILARMREEYDATGSTNEAVVRGIGRTGRLVTSAALILFLAFSSLTAGPDVIGKIIGTGLGAGILLDATVVRMLLVPALVSLVGRWNWWLPTRPARILRVQPSLVPVRVLADRDR